MADTNTTRRVIVLGSTGSIGVNTLDVIAHLNALAETCNGDGLRFEVVGLAAGRRADTLIEQARRFNVKQVAIADASQVEAVKSALPGATVHVGPNAALELVEVNDATDLAAAIVGSAGLPATIAAIRKGMRISLANKETLVAAGALVTPMVRQHGATLIPVDSEHSAIFQCLEGGKQGIKGPSHQATKRGTDASPSVARSLGPSVASAPKRIVLTASGGPFRTTDKATMHAASVEQALNHPTWDMGAKITIDSASMMNKALEIVEAHWLFDLPAEQIDVIVHPQSIIHSFVEFEDNSVLAQLGPPDMRTPIQYALTYPDRPAGCSDALDWTTLSQLTFERPDFDKFPSLRMGFEVIEAGGSAGAVFNAANEAAVDAFLNRRIPFGRIFDLVAEALSAIGPQPVASLDDVLAADGEARAFVEQAVGHDAPTTGTR